MPIYLGEITSTHVVDADTLDDAKDMVSDIAYELIPSGDCTVNVKEIKQ